MRSEWGVTGRIGLTDHPLHFSCSVCNNNEHRVGIAHLV
jgi:hypothetical protein